MATAKGALKGPATAMMWEAKIYWARATARYSALAWDVTSAQSSEAVTESA